jgi:3-(3-hydroxy-phenyl)propionate hydroxylase
MINLQQYYLEQYLIERARQLPNLEIRFKNKVISVVPGQEQATVRVETPAGPYSLTTDWLIVADGASRCARCWGWTSRARSSWTAFSSPTW